ncbi:unnamed protein product [Amoebophrya sp. A25]|nr:unnamed protein product [Amoebophrya sp. A25]|eukprot:GSA25T00000725001.1
MGGGKKGKGKGKKGAPPTKQVAPELVVLHNLAKDGKLQEMEDHPMTEMNLLYNDHISRVPLHLAAYYGHNEVVERILEICPESSDRQAQDGFLPAHFAAQQGHMECLRILVQQAGKKDEDIRVGGVRKLMRRLVKGEKNILHLACAKQHVEVALYLVEKGCDLFAKNAQGKTAFELLEEEHRRTVKAKLESIAKKKKDEEDKKHEKHGGSVQVGGSSSSSKQDMPSSSGSGSKKVEVAGKLATTADEMEAKLAAMLSGSLGEGAAPPAPAPVVAGAKRKSVEQGDTDTTSRNTMKSKAVVEAAPPPPAKKAKFSLEDVLKDSYG